MACEAFFAAKLREKGLRLTPQRELILSALHEIDGLATAEQVYERVQAHRARVDCSGRLRQVAIDISTVYRTLELLQQFGLVACVDAGEEVRRYELLGLHGPHIHLVCQRCGMVRGVDVQEARSFAEQLYVRHGFRPDLEHLTISGLCADCAGLQVAQDA